MDNRKNVAVIVGGYLGDEGKGKATQAHLNDMERREGATGRLCIRSSGGTNTGATVYVGRQKIGIHMVPIGAFAENCHSYIGNGCYVNLTTLIEELKIRRDLSVTTGFISGGRIFVSLRAHLVTDSYLVEDKDKENRQKLGSTKNGVSVAAGRKYTYAGVTVGDLYYGTEYGRKSIIRDHEYNRLVDAIRTLDIEFGVEFIEPYDLFEGPARDWDVVIEGTQGVGLDVNHGFEYPYVSAGSFSPFGLLDGVGYALAPTDVCMVLKVYGSYFGPQRERGDFDNPEFRDYAGEYGTTTGRPRNLCWLDAEKLRRVASLVKPTAIMLNCVDRLNWFAEQQLHWKLVLDDEHMLEFSDPAIYNMTLTNAGQMFVETIEEYCDAPVKFLGVGPKHDDVIAR